MKNRLALIYVAAIVVIAGGLLFNLRHDTVLQNHPLHSVMETVEAIAAILMALFLLQRKGEDAAGANTPLALGFLGMGSLNAVHATLAPGDGFVFLRAAASLAGGIGFSLVWLPGRYKAILNRPWMPGTVIAGSLFISAAAFLFPHLLPVMIEGTRFTFPAVMINLVAGMLFIAGGVGVMLAQHRFNVPEYLLFSLIGLFFGLSSLTFQYSTMWSEAWWYWHTLRLLGSLLVLGSLVYRHFQTVRDLKTSLLERNNVERSLTHSYELTKTIIDSMNDSISLLDVRDFRIIGVNRVFLEEYGYSSEADIIGRHCYEVTHRRRDVCSPPDDICPLAETVRTGKHFAVDHVHYGSAGEKKFVEVSTSPIKNEEGKVVQVVHVARDITDRKRAEHEREQLLLDLERSNKDLEQFAYIASHDLKEPLRMVSIYVQLLEKKYKERLDDKADTYIRFAVEGAARMDRLIEGLLSYSRAARGTVEFKPVDSNKVFSLAVSNLAATIRECRAAITKEDLPLILGDETQLLQLLQNLIGNAVKYRKPGAEPRVHISARLQKDDYVFSVKDNGIGIEEKDFERIFHVFQRLHSQDEYTGTGIGLAVCKRIVERHHGRIWIESVPGKGSTFFFTIPVYREAG